jgi:hypothetical protein
MKIELRLGDDTVREGTAAPGATSVLVSGKCPECKGEPFYVGGIKGTQSHTHDQHLADAGCLACGKGVGKLVVTVDTIFGIDADEEMLSRSRCRVY